MQLLIDDYGKYLGVGGQEFVVYENRKVVENVPLYRVKRAVISSGNYVSSSALFWLGIYGVETPITTKTGKIVSVLVPYNTDNRVQTRLKQYEAYNNHRGVEIAKGFVKARVQSEIALMKKHNLDP